MGLLVAIHMYTKKERVRISLKIDYQIGLEHDFKCEPQND